MKKKTNQFARAAMMLLLAVLGTFGTWAQSSVVTVGSTTYGHSYLPSSPNNKYSTSQQIYTSDEIDKAGIITSIAFYNYDTGSERSCDIYLSHTAKAAFDNEAGWVTVAESDKVFSGTVKLASGWTVIDFDTPFQYNGTQNLLLTVDDNTGKSTGYNYNIGSYSATGHQALFYYNSENLDPTQSITEEGVFHPSYSSDERKNCIQLCFETYPKPYKLEAPEIGNVSALIQCSLRGGAAAWNLRYRKVGDADWTAFSALTDPSKTIEELTANTKYEAQVQAVFTAEEEGGEDHLSGWTESLVFTTACCPVEEQAEIIYAVNSNYSSWYGYAIQFMDITDEENPVEVAYINPPSYDFTGGTITLCCGHKYKVNWIYDADHDNVNGSFSLALYFEPGDLFYSMARGEAPEETAELTTFVMDCGDYCAPMPQNVSVAGTTFNSATLSFVSETTGGEVVYSTEADFDPEAATPTTVSFDALSVSADPWGGTPDNAALTLTGLEPLTEYYVRVRSVCVGDLPGVSRWSDPVKVTTGSRYDAPTQVVAEPINSSKEQLSWGSRGNEKGHNLYYRQQAAGTAVDASAVQTFGGGKGTGFENGSWGDGIFSSYGDRPFSNTLFVADVPAGSSFSFKAGNGKTGAGQTKFLYGMRKVEGPLTAEETMKQFDRKCLNDAYRQARINDLQAKKAELEAQLAALELKLANGEITQEEYNQQKEDIDKEIEAVNEIIDELKTLPTDAQKLEQMRILEQKIGNNVAAMAALALKYNNDEITKDELTQNTDALEAQNALYGAELSELRAITTNAENPQKDGFSITREQESANAPHRAAESDTYVFFVRHDDPNGVLLVKDLTITPPDQVGAWTVIKNIGKTEYALAGLEPSTAYEVMVEPVYEDGTTGTPSAITVFTTLDEAVEPVLADFSVSEGKKVNFAHGNLRCEGERYEDEWSMAPQQYDILGQDNIEVYGTRSYPAWLVDLFCWSTEKNYYGVSSYYNYDDDEAKPYFNGEFADWGECPSLIRDLGPGWSTLSKAEWNYLLNERENAASRKALATVNEVKGLIILPDEWTAPAGVAVTAGGTYTAEQWSALEDAGAVFLPAAGQMTTTYENNKANTTVTEAGSYWTSTPSGDKSDLNAIALTIGEEGATVDADLSRRVMTAVRLVKCKELSVTTAASGFTTLVSNASLDFSNIEGLTAYIATNVDNTEGTVTLKRIEVVPANTPIVVKGAPSTTYSIAAILTTANPPSENLLRGSATKSVELEANTAYVLSGGKFHKNNAGTMPAGKAYLPAGTLTNGARMLTIVIDGDATAILSIDVEETPSRTGIYNLQGQRVKTPGKGIYIINGNKVFIK